MNENPFSKQQQFLWIVQTTILANGINLASMSETAEQYRDCISATGTFIVAAEAVRASECIPMDRAASEAANEFCTFMIRNLREIEEMARAKKMTVPFWFARP